MNDGTWMDHFSIDELKQFTKVMWWFGWAVGLVTGIIIGAWLF